MNYHKKFFSLACIAVLFAAGCGYDGDSEPVETSSVTVSGTASKGIIKSGIVTFFGVDSSGARLANALATTTTNDTGGYSAIIENYVGPVFVDITASSTTTMVCDIPAGCGTQGDSVVAFGADYSLATSFELSAVVPEIEDGVATTANVTPLTDLAAEIAEDAITAAVAAVTDSSASAIQAAIESAVEESNDTVSVLFFDDVGVDITQLPVVDITDTTAVAAVTDDSVLQAAMLSSAIVSAGLESGQSSIEAALQSVVDTFVENEGSFVGSVDTATVIDLDDIMTEALEVISSVEETLTNAGTTSELIAAIETSVETKQEEAEQAGSETIVVVVPEEQDSPLEQAKNFVDDLRDVLTALGAGLNDAAPVESSFPDQIETANQIINGNFDELVNVLEEVTYSMGASGAGMTLDGNITVTGSGSTRTIEGSSEGVTVSLETSDFTDTNGVGSATITSGTFTQGNLSMTVSGGMLSWNVASSNGTDTATLGVADMAVAISITGGANFTGTIDYDANGISETSTTETFVSRELDFDGTFSSGDTSFNAGLNMMLDGENYEESDDTESGFIGWNTILSFSAVLAGIDNTTNITLSGEASGEDSNTAVGAAELVVRFNGQSLTFATSDIEVDEIGVDIEENFVLTIADSFGVVLEATKNTNGISGDIEVNGTQYATFINETEDSSDLIRFSFTDSSFATLQ